MKKFFMETVAAVMAVCIVLTGCGKKNDNDIGPADTTQEQQESTVTGPFEDGLLSPDETVYTLQTVENEENLAIFKLSCEIPDGYQVMVDDKEGKLYYNEKGCSVNVKAHNFKDQFKDLATFADAGCANIKMANMLSQADTDFSEPVNTTVAGFDAVRYDYTVTAYYSVVETDANGEAVLDDEGKPVYTGEKILYGEYVNRVYYFYSDEDVFYIICEAPKAEADASQEVFDKFIESVKIS